MPSKNSNLPYLYELRNICSYFVLSGVGPARPTNPDISSSETSMVLADTITVDPRTISDTELISLRQALVDCRHSLQNSGRELGDLRTERGENDRRLTQAAEAARTETARVQVCMVDLPLSLCLC